VLARAVPAAERSQADVILAAVDTKRGELYLQTFDAATQTPRGEPVALPPAEIPNWMAERNVVVIGDGAPHALGNVSCARASAAHPLPNAVILAEIAATRGADPAGPLPLYVLPPKITLAPHGGRLRPALEENGRLRPDPQS